MAVNSRKLMSGSAARLMSLWQKIPLHFYSYEEYEAAVEMLYEIINLQGESVSGQLDGQFLPQMMDRRRTHPLL